MRRLVFAALGLALAFLGRPAAAQTPIPFVELPCAPENGAPVICGQRHPEDLIHIAGSNWVIASYYDVRGGLGAINIRDKTTLSLYPAQGARSRHDRAAFRDCPSTPAPDAPFIATGFTVAREKRGHRIYVIRHGERHAIEVFDLDLRRNAPTATWVGCVLAPPGANLNSLATTPDGGIVASNFLPPSADPVAARAHMEAGRINAEVLEWNRRTGWAKVPGAETSGGNGLLLSKDGKWIYVNGFGSKSFIRVSRGANPPRRQEIPLGFRADNLRWAPDGSILTAGLADDASWVFSIDPKTLKATRLFVLPNTPTFYRGSVAIRVGDEIWVGTSRADRILRLPAPKK